MAYTQDEVDTLKRALARGATRVRLNGEEVQYDSLAALRRQIRVMEAEIAGGSAGQMTVSYPKTGRAL